MGEIDLVPTDYRRSLRLRAGLRRFACVYLAVVLALGMANAGLAYGVRAKHREIEELEAARALEKGQRVRLSRLRQAKAGVEKRLEVLSGLRGGVAAKEMFTVVDRALDGNVWFLDWSFQRAGEVVEKEPETVRAGYFIVLPLEKRGDGEKSWLLRTHMEIRAQAVDHSALANFVRRLVDQPQVGEVRVLDTQIRRTPVADVVDFELALVVKTQA